MDISLLAKGGLGIRIALSDLSSLISESTPEILDQRQVDLKIFSADFVVSRSSEIKLREIDYKSVEVSLDIEISAYKSLLVADFRLDGALRLFMKLSFEDSSQWLTVHFDRYEWITPIRMEPLNLSGIVTTKAEEKIDEMIPVILKDMNQKINDDIDLKLQEKLNEVSEKASDSDLNKHIHIECSTINRRVLNGELLLSLDGLYLETSDVVKSHLNSTKLRNTDVDLDMLTTFHIIIEVGESVLKDQIQSIDLPGHSFELAALEHSKGYLRMNFENTHGIVGDFTIWLDIGFVDGMISVKPYKIKFEKKLIKFLSNFNWSQDVLLDIIEKKIRKILEENINKVISEMPLSAAKLLDKVNFSELKVHSKDGSIEALLITKIEPIAPMALKPQQ